MSYLVHEILSTTVGDANLDRVFDSSDLVQVFVAGEYEDNVIGNSGWADGDWDCDGDFTTSDLVAAFQDGGYVAAAIPASSRAEFDADSADRSLASPAFLSEIAATERVTAEAPVGQVEADASAPRPTASAADVPLTSMRRIDPLACDRIWESGPIATGASTAEDGPNGVVLDEPERFTIDDLLRVGR